MKSLRACLAVLSLAALPALADPAPPAASAVPAPAAKPAASDAGDLGEGLGYVRVHRLADALPELERRLSSDPALVVDLRYAKATEQDVPALALALARRAAAAPLFVLVSPQTPAVLVPALIKIVPPALTLGIDGSLPAPAVVVAQPAEVDRRAYDAFDGGMTLAALVTGKIEKERFDEAELVKEFQNGNANAAPPPEPDPSKPADQAPVLTDRVLQRALHLHRALAALRRG